MDHDYVAKYLTLCVPNTRRRPMHLPLDEQFLRWAEKAVGIPRLIQMIDEALDRVAPHETRTEFLNRLKIRGHWQRAIIDGVIKSYADLATVIRAAELPVVIDTR